MIENTAKSNPIQHNEFREGANLIWNTHTLDQIAHNDVLNHARRLDVGRQFLVPKELWRTERGAHLPHVTIVCETCQTNPNQHRDPAHGLELWKSK